MKVMRSHLTSTKLCGRSCKGICILLIGVLLLGSQLRVEEKEDEPVLGKPHEAAVKIKGIDRKNAEANTTNQNTLQLPSAHTLETNSANQTEMNNPKLTQSLRPKVEMKKYRGRLREKLQQLRLKNVLQKEENGTAWIISYPGKYLKFPHNFEKVGEKYYVHVYYLDIPVS